MIPAKRPPQMSRFAKNSKEEDLDREDLLRILHNAELYDYEGKITSIEKYKHNKSTNLPTMLNCSQPRGVTWPQTPDFFFLRVQSCGTGTKWTLHRKSSQKDSREVSARSLIALDIEREIY